MFIFVVVFSIWFKLNETNPQKAYRYINVVNDKKKNIKFNTNKIDQVLKKIKKKTQFCMFTFPVDWNVESNSINFKWANFEKINSLWWFNRKKKVSRMNLAQLIILLILVVRLFACTFIFYLGELYIF